MKLQWVDWSSAIMHTTSCQQDILTFAPEVLRLQAVLVRLGSDLFQLIWPTLIV